MKEYLVNAIVTVGPWRAVEYREFDMEHQIALAQEALEQEFELHPDDCPWWEDWHRCSCGAFDVKDSPVDSSKKV